MNEYLMSCDWGTTAFRLRLVNTKENKVISEWTSLEGIARTFEEWKSTQNQTDKLTFFKAKLKKHIAALAHKSNKTLENIDILISGMVSSSIGMFEVAYANLPFNVDGSQANIHEIEADKNFPHKIILISGVKSETDVMRGEETQMIGLIDLLKLPITENFILILPGTHSKHLSILKNSLTDFQTYMTGEMYHIISNHSILKDSVDMGNTPDFSQKEKEAFKKGVVEAQSTNLLNSLFKVRTNQLFEKLNKKENGLYLSGLLIGSELKHLNNELNRQIILCSGSNLYAFYTLGIDILGLTEQTIIVSPEMIDKAIIAGQIKILQNKH